MSQAPPQFGSGTPGAGGPIKPHRGTLIMVLGIVSIFVCQIILGPIAWIMGRNDIKEMAAGRMDRTGEGPTNTGRICGMIGTLIGIAILAIWCLVIILGVVGGGMAQQ